MEKYAITGVFCFGFIHLSASSIRDCTLGTGVSLSFYRDNGIAGAGG
jgi:hypothetical protein